MEDDINTIGEGCGNKEPYALQVTDNSMEPEFPDGCVVIIEPMERCNHGHFVFAEHGEERWFRQYIEADGRRYLMPLNDIYPEIEITLPFTVIGLIVQSNIKRKIKHYKI